MIAQPRPDAGARATVAHRSSLFPEFLGLVVRPQGNWAPVSAMVALMEEVGFDEPIVRAMVSRQKNRGWLVAEKRGRQRGYRLAERALDNLAMSDEFVWHPREEAPAEEGWVLVTFSVPESARAKRHVLRSRLAAVGFGALGRGTLIAPARMLDAAERVLEENNLREFVEVFLADLPPGADAARMIRRGWDIDELNAEYREFIEVYRPVAEQLESRLSGGPAEEQNAEAFRDYLLCFNRWRRLPLKDPGLPSAMLGPSWAGREAGKLFEKLVDMLKERALRHAATYW